MTLVFSKFSKLHVLLCNLCGQFWEKWLKVLVTLILTCPQVQVITCANSHFFWSITFTFTWKSTLAQRYPQITLLRFRVIPFGWSDQDLDLRSLGSWCVKGTSGSQSGWDFAVPLMHHDPSDTIGARGSGIGDPESWSGLITPWHQMQSIHLSKNSDTYLLVPVCKFHWQVTSALLLAFASSWWKLTQDARALRVHENYSGFHLSGQAQMPRKCTFCFLDVKPLKIEPVGNIPCKQTSGGPVSVPL